MMVSDKSENPQRVGQNGDSGDGHGSLVVFVVVERRVGEVLGPGIASETTHLLSTYYCRTT
jgi:hypothetical protein